MKSLFEIVVFLLFAFTIDPVILQEKQPKKLPIGITDIRRLIEDGYVYVDKTGLIYEMMMEHHYDYFMIRPKGFGKTLFLSTLEEIFKGNKKLFENTAIHGCDFSWMPFPILRFDFSKMDPRDFEADLRKVLRKMEKAHGVHPTVDKNTTASGQLQKLVEQLSKNGTIRVVILVDEYDSPVTRSLNVNITTGEKTRAILVKFLDTVMSLSDDFLQFIFITGVNQFSVCGPQGCGHDHLVDLTLNPKYATMMGFSRDELEKYFVNHVVPAEHFNWDEIQTLHNDYRFSDGNVSVFCPSSTLSYMNAKGNESSSPIIEKLPSFLIDSVRTDPQILFDLRKSAVEGFPLRNPIDVAKRVDLEPFLFQSGHLTIRGYDERDALPYYKLDFRNERARKTFFANLLRNLTHLDPLQISQDGEEMRRTLDTLDMDAFIGKMYVHISEIPIEIRQNGSLRIYHAIFYLLLENVGLKTKVEYDCTRMEVSNVAVVFQFTYNQTAATAALEIAVESHKRRISVDKKTYCVGINFGSESHNIQEWKAELYDGKDIVQISHPKQLGGEFKNNVNR